MPRIYRNMKDHLREFEQFRKAPITFESLDLNFYEEFVHLLTYEFVQKRRKDKQVGLKTNTVGKTIKQFAVEEYRCGAKLYDAKGQPVMWGTEG
jgi:hypothetical protein